MTAANPPENLNNQLISAIWKEGMVRASGVQDAFRKMPRHLFLPDVPLEEVYKDQAIPLKYDRAGRLISSCSQPTMIATMLDQLRLKPGDNVLEIGTASGYNAALMSCIVGQAGHVTSIEIDKDLATQAERNLSRAKVVDVRVVHADAASGYLPRAAYDHIVATAGVWDIPQTWVRQLKDGGNLLVPIWVDGIQLSAKFRKQVDGTLLSEDNRSCAFVYMRGEEAAPNLMRQIGSTSLYVVSDDVPLIDTVRLHTLLSDDHDLINIEPRLKPRPYWSGLQLYLMMNTPITAQFFLYTVADDRAAYGLKGQGIAVLLPSSAVFAPYDEMGVIHGFGGSEAAVLLQELVNQWIAEGRPSLEQLRLRLIPKTNTAPIADIGRIYDRRYHLLQLWQESPVQPS